MQSVATTAPNARIIVVDDGSKVETASWLDQWVPGHAAELIRHVRPRGYTRAANQALAAASGDYVVLLNSDTIVPPRWLDRLMDPFVSDQLTGLVGPLSNAATWQSVPTRFNADGHWCDGDWMRPEDLPRIDELVQELSTRTFPRVPLLNGFCLALARAAIDVVGLFDERSFPRGYGEENDYCLRAAAKGLHARVADHLFVYHAKSQSYGTRRRRWLRWRAGRALHRKHGAAEVARHADRLRSEPALAQLRAALSQALLG